MLHCWPFWARSEQIAPDGDWQFWLLLAGRGYGKTRVAVEWARGKAYALPGSRGFICGRTAGDVRDTLIEGESGFLAVSPPDFMPVYEASKRRLTWPNGSQATLFSAERPDQARGPSHHWGIADELAAWKYARETWDNLMLGLRLGDNPQCVIATTPRPIPIIKDLVKDTATHLTTGSTYDNRANLAIPFFRRIVAKYEGTRLGRQELHAEILDDVPGALWTRAMIDDAIVSEYPPLVRIVIAIDPQGVKGEETADTGIVAVGIDDDDNGYVLEDLTVNGSPGEWAKQALLGFDKWRADRIIAESNHGGDMVEHTIRTQRRNAPITLIRASRGKYTRAEPIAAFYEQGRVKHVGSMPLLEDQLCEWVPGEDSPDRLDALVWGLTELMPLTASRQMQTASVDFYAKAEPVIEPQPARSVAEIEAMLSG